MGPRTRTFIALPLEQATVKKVARLIDELQPVVPKVRWVRRENLHVTLAFLGDVETTQIPALCSAVQAAANSHSSFALTPHGLGAFPNLTRPSTLWIGFSSGTEPTAELQKSIVDALEPFGYRREERPFVPHLTIGRIRSRSRLPGEASARFAALADWEAPVSQATEVLIMGSELGPAGPTYTVLGRAPLG